MAGRPCQPFPIVHVQRGDDRHKFMLDAISWLRRLPGRHTPREEFSLAAPSMRTTLHEVPARGQANPTGKEPKPSRTEQAREVVEEYASDQREIFKKLRKLRSRQ